MADIVVFHPALGLRPAVQEFADALRNTGRRVHTPDLYEGRTFSDVEAGVAERDRIGVDVLLERAATALQGLPDEVIYAGFSMGAMTAQLFAATRPSARGALLIQGGGPLDRLGIDRWPDGVPVQIHVADDDPWFDRAAAETAAAELPLGQVDLQSYATDGHLFFDADGPNFDPTATQAMMAAIERWLADNDPPSQGRDA